MPIYLPCFRVHDLINLSLTVCTVSLWIILTPCDPWRALYWALPKKTVFSFYHGNGVLPIIHLMCGGFDQPLVVAGQKKKIWSMSRLSIFWLSLCLKCPVIWSYHSLALALSHWKINKLLVAYPPPPPSLLTTPQWISLPWFLWLPFCSNYISWSYGCIVFLW